MRRQKSSRKNLSGEYDRKKEELFETIRISSHFGLGRLLRAFPQMKHRDFDELLKELQKRM